MSPGESRDMQSAINAKTGAKTSRPSSDSTRSKKRFNISWSLRGNLGAPRLCMRHTHRNCEAQYRREKEGVCRNVEIKVGKAVEQDGYDTAHATECDDAFEVAFAGEE